jgi:ATP-binding cassette subfamily F protein 3
MIDLFNISLQFNGKYLFQNVNYRISAGDRISLVGANGTGKTSILRIINSEIEPESGNIYKQKNISIGYLPQDQVTHAGRTLIDEAQSALTDIVKLYEKEKQLSQMLSSDQNLNENERIDLVNQLGEVHHRLEELDSFSATSKVEKILLGLGFEENDFDKLTNQFSGGWQMRIALAKILIKQNDVLLMDEPTNHLDFDSLAWLIEFLKAFKGALAVVSHDKNFINQITNKTLEIFNEKFYSYSGDYDSYLKYKAERDEQTVQLYEQQQRKLKDTQRFIERFRYKNTKARQVQSRIKQLEKIDLIELPEDKAEINIRFPEPSKSGRVNIELNNIYKSYGSNKVFSNAEFKVERGEKIAFVGPNGAGKTTLAKIIAGVIDFESGERVIGHNTLISYYAQDVADNLNPELDIIETLDGIAQDKTIGQLRSLLGSFLFTGDDVFKKVGVLSGGEKSRVALCKILLTKSNFIILDEPTNHLDYSSKQILQTALLNFSGSLILVSHDIDFLRPIVNRVVDIRKGNIKNYPGDIDYYLSKRDELKISETNQIKHFSKDDALSRKEQKRIEAENRQKKYSATKELQRRILETEKRISELEEISKNLEIELTDPNIYSNPELTKETTRRFKEAKNELEKILLHWEELNEELSIIEAQFT